VYGRYPYGSTGGVADDAPSVGYSLENQTKPQYAYAPDELTVAHELAHQWFGDYYAMPASSWVWTPPPGDPGDAADIFAGSVYERGAMTLQALRHKIGDPTFFRLL